MKIYPLISSIPLLVMATSAAAETPSSVALGGFVDAYYAYDFNSPPTRDRAFTTQPARNNEFNVNLAYIEGKVERERIHGRLALQAGTSVQSNYAGEPTIGSVSGPGLSRNLQEAYAGYRLGGNTWIDAGIMLSHIGVESFISKDNIVYTRSLVADYSPYYETGVRLTSILSDRLSVQLLVLNGWQNISESNSNKAIGTQLSYAFSPKISIVYNTFFGREASFRHFHDFILKFTPNESWTLHLQADVGFQDHNQTVPEASWNGFSLMAKRQVSQSVAGVARVEHYTDPKQVLITTGTGAGFKAWSSSLGIDKTLDTGAWWRNEVRGYWAADAVFPDKNGFKKNDGVIVSSISVAF